MARHILICLSNSTSGQDKEFRRWYVEQHIPDVLRVEGFVSGKLMPASAFQTRQDLAERWKYLAVFELDTKDIAATMGELMRRLGTPAMPMTDAFDMQTMHLELFDGA